MQLWITKLLTDMGVYKTTSEQRMEIYEAFERYIVADDFPIMAGFVSADPVAIKYLVSKQNMFDWKEMRPLVDRAITKTENYLVRKGMNGQSAAMAIFVLKQAWHGYKDRTDQNITSDGEKVKFYNTLPRTVKASTKAVKSAK